MPQIALNADRGLVAAGQREMRGIDFDALLRYVDAGRRESTAADRIWRRESRLDVGQLLIDQVDELADGHVVQPL